MGALQAGSSANIIPDHAPLRLNIRTFDEQVRERVLSSVKRIVTRQAELSRSPRPRLQDAERLPADGQRRGRDAGGDGRPAGAHGWRPRPAGQRDLCERGLHGPGPRLGVPSVYWLVGGTDLQKYAEAEKAGRVNDLPSNHSPEFAPVPDPTLRVGVETMLAVAGAWLVPASAKP